MTTGSPMTTRLQGLQSELLEPAKSHNLCLRFFGESATIMMFNLVLLDKQHSFTGRLLPSDQLTNLQERCRPWKTEGDACSI